MTVEASCESMYMLPVGEWLHIQKFYLSFRYRRDLYQSLLNDYLYGHSVFVFDDEFKN